LRAALDYHKWSKAADTGGFSDIVQTAIKAKMDGLFIEVCEISYGYVKN
jgi:hypothetical protein